MPPHFPCASDEESLSEIDLMLSQEIGGTGSRHSTGNPSDNRNYTCDTALKIGETITARVGVDTWLTPGSETAPDIYCVIKGIDGVIETITSKFQSIGFTVQDDKSSNSMVATIPVTDDNFGEMLRKLGNILKAIEQ